MTPPGPHPPAAPGDDSVRRMVADAVHAIAYAQRWEPPIPDHLLVTTSHPECLIGTRHGVPLDGDIATRIGASRYLVHVHLPEPRTPLPAALEGFCFHDDCEVALALTSPPAGHHIDVVAVDRSGEAGRARVAARRLQRFSALEPHDARVDPVVRALYRVFASP